MVGDESRYAARRGELAWRTYTIMFSICRPSYKREKVAQGDMIVVRYADDLVADSSTGTKPSGSWKSFKERLARSSGWSFIGENAIDRVRSIRAGQPETAWGGKAGDIRVSRVAIIVGRARRVTLSSGVGLWRSG